ncbi:MAG: hypothetical protein ACXW4H_02630 [Candidatus Limnocylindrales bacterium]
MATVDADLVRGGLRRFLIDTGAGAELGFSDDDVWDLLDQVPRAAGNPGLLSDPLSTRAAAAAA